MTKVLITSNTLDSPLGSELYVLDVAEELLRRGWEPIVFSNGLGALAEELHGRSIQVVNDLAALTVRPDMIHAHHHLDAMAAIQRFPRVPVVFFCHGWTAWERTPLMHPQIVKYVAVDRLGQECLVSEYGIPEQQVELLLNFVDLERFQTRAPLPERAAKALLFSDHLQPGQPIFDAVQVACTEAGIHLDTASHSSVARPQELFPEYELVFAQGLSALEAQAVGCSTILCDAEGLGGLVTPANFDQSRGLNFDFRLLRQNANPTAEDVALEIKKYQAADAAQVSQRVRAEADRKTAVDRLVALYETVFAIWGVAPTDPTQEQLATSAYLVWLSNETKSLRGVADGGLTAKPEHESVIEYAQRLEQQVRKLNAANERIQGQLQSRQIESISWISRMADKNCDQSAIEQRLRDAQKHAAELSGQSKSLKAKLDKAQKEGKDWKKRAEESRERLRRFRGLRRFLPGFLVRSKKSKKSKAAESSKNAKKKS